MRYFLLILISLFASTTFAANTVTLAWEPSPTPDVGYIIYYAPTATALTADPMTMCSATVTENCAYARNVGPVLTTVISDLPPGDWYFAATAYNALDQSVQSNQVTTSFTAYQPPADVVHEPIVIPLPPGGTVTITVTP